MNFAPKDSDTVFSELKARYDAAIGESLAPADPRTLLLRTIALLLTQLRGIIDFAGKQSLLRYVSDLWVDELAALWREDRLAATPSRCVLRFSAGTAGTITIAAGKRATDGVSLWAVKTTTVSSNTATHLDVIAECITPGAASNGVPIGRISSMVDDIPGISSVANTTETSGGTNVETLAQFRERLRIAPESGSPAGPRARFEALARAASGAVGDVVALGSEDAPYTATLSAPGPAEVELRIIECTRGVDNEIASVVPTPSGDLIATVLAAVTDPRVRPMSTSVTVVSPSFVDVDVIATYYVSAARADDLPVIQLAVADAFDAYCLWQQSKIGRDANPSELIARLVSAGAKRLVVTQPAYLELKRDECIRLGYQTLTYGGLEDE